MLRPGETQFLKNKLKHFFKQQNIINNNNKIYSVLLCAIVFSKDSTCISFSSLTATHELGTIIKPHFIDEETEAQKDLVTSLQSQGSTKWYS